MTNPLMVQDIDNELLRDADEYLRKHKILELFEVWHQAKKLIMNYIGSNNYSCLQTTWEYWGFLSGHAEVT